MSFDGSVIVFRLCQQTQKKGLESASLTVSGSNLQCAVELTDHSPKDSGNLKHNCTCTMYIGRIMYVRFLCCVCCSDCVFQTTINVIITQLYRVLEFNHAYWRKRHCKTDLG